MGDERGGARDPAHARGYRKLIAWQKSHQLATTIYSVTRVFPRENSWAQRLRAEAGMTLYRLIRSLETPAPRDGPMIREPHARYLAGSKFDAYQDEINGAVFDPLTQ